MQKVLHDVSARALQLHGSLGTTHEMPFVQYLVESFVLGLADGPTEVHKVTLARQLLKDYEPAPGHLPVRTPAAAARGRRGQVRRPTVGRTTDDLNERFARVHLGRYPSSVDARSSRWGSAAAISS